jgi:hypothetical protein
MKILTPFILVAGLLVASSAVADNDLTMLGNLKPNESKPVKVYIPVGELTIQVFSTKDDNEFTCRFLDGAGNLGLEQKHATKCVGHFTSNQHGHITVVILNEQNRAIDYKIVLQKS